MRRCAFLTLEDPSDYAIYDRLAVEPLAARGWAVDEVPWTRAVDWGQYEAVVVRSPWDYTDDPGRFLAVLAEIEASGARLGNGLRTCRWNLEKTYLRELAERGVALIPTVWGDRLSGPDEAAAWFDHFGADELVVKPVVGATAEGAFRLRRGDSLGPLAAFYRDRAFQAQPFVRDIVETGETSVFAFLGETSHAVLKTPAAGDFRVQEEWGGHIQATRPAPDMRAAAEHALAVSAECVGEPLLYARADLVRLDDGTPAIIEIELIEPSLYFPYDAASPARFADAFVRWVDG